MEQLLDTSSRRYWLLVVGGTVLFYLVGCYVEQAPVSPLFLW